MLDSALIARLVARPMCMLSAFTYPLVPTLSFVTDGVARLFGADVSDEPPVTHEEVRVLMDKGREAGVFGKHEQDTVRRVFALEEQQASAVMTQRLDLISIQLDGSIETLRSIVRRRPDSHYPMGDCAGQTVALLRTKTLVDKLLSGEAADGLVQKLDSVSGARRKANLGGRNYGRTQARALCTQRGIASRLRQP